MRLRVVIFREGEHLVAQCLEHDIAAQGATLADVQDAFLKELVKTIILALELNREPLKAIPKAPETYWNMFKSVEASPWKHEMPIPSSDPRVPAWMANSVAELRLGL